MIAVLVILLIVLVVVALEKLTSNNGEKLGCVSGPIAVIVVLFLFYLFTSNDKPIFAPSTSGAETLIPGDFVIDSPSVQTIQQAPAREPIQPEQPAMPNPRQQASSETDALEHERNRKMWSPNG